MEELNSKEENIVKQASELEDTKRRVDELKHELEAKSSEIRLFAAEIKELGQEKAQLSQNVAELEAKKIELMTKLHSSPSGSPKKEAVGEDAENAAADTENEEQQKRDNDLTELIKVGAAFV